MAIDPLTKREPNGRIPQLWTIQSALEESKKYKTKKDFRTLSSSAYQYLVRHGCLSSISLKGKRHKLDQWDIFCAAKKSLSVGDFRTSYPNEYTAFKKRKDSINQSVLNHMPRSKTAKFWTHERIIDEAKKYSYRSEFSRASSGAYDAAINCGILNEACSHMKLLGSDCDCVYVWTAKKDKSIRIIKVGVTSKRLGMARINFVKQKSGFCATEIVIQDCLNAIEIESKILSIGNNAELPIFSGSTEFRVVDENQYLEIIKAIKHEAII